MAQFGADNFTDTSGTSLASHTPSGGGSWASHSSYSGVAQISNANRLRGDSTGASYLYYHSGSPGSADYTVQADVYRLTGAGEDHGPAGRIDTSANTCYSACYRHSSTQWELFKAVSGTVTSLGSWAETLANGDTRVCKLSMVGSAIKCFVDGTERIAATDSSITAAGKAGLRKRATAAGTDTTRYHLDNYSADDVSTGYTLTVDSASYTLTHGSVGLTEGLLLSVSTAAYTYTPATVGTNRGYSLAASTASYTYTASSVGTLVGDLLAVSTAAYSYTATDVGLTKTGSYSLAVSTAAYTLSHGTVGLTTTGNYTLSATEAAYALSPASVTLKVARSVAADNQSLTLTHANVTFSVPGAGASGSYHYYVACLMSRPGPF